MRRLTALFPSKFLEEHAEELGEFLGYSPPPLLDRLIEDAQKIHKQRPILQETLATATQPRCES
jgi:putative transposase